MPLPQLVDTIASADWFSKIGTYSASDNHLAITDLLSPDVSVVWHWLPTSRDEIDPFYSLSLREMAEQQERSVEAKNATTLIYKATLVSLRSVYEDDARFKFGPHNFSNAAKGGALYAARQSAIEIVLGQASHWCSLIALYSKGYWPCGYTESRRILVY